MLPQRSEMPDPGISTSLLQITDGLGRVGIEPLQ